MQHVKSMARLLSWHWIFFLPPQEGARRYPFTAPEIIFFFTLSIIEAFRFNCAEFMNWVTGRKW